MQSTNPKINAPPANNEFLKLIAGTDIKPLSIKKPSLNRLEMLILGLIIGIGCTWGIQTALNPHSPNNQLYEQNERKIKAMQRASSVDIIKFRDNCFQMQPSPERKEVLK